MLSNAVVVVKVFSFYLSIVVEISEQAEESEQQQSVCTYEPVIKRQSAELREFQKDSTGKEVSTPASGWPRTGRGIT